MTRIPPSGKAPRPTGPHQPGRKPGNRRPGRLFLLLALPFALIARVGAEGPRPEDEARADVVVYGATPGGIAAAIAAAEGGQGVILVEPTDRIGGMTTCGLSHTDFHSFESLTGAFLDFSRRVEAHYVRAFGAGSPQVRDSFRGTFAEPKVNLEVFERMLVERPRIVLRTRSPLVSVAATGRDGGRRIETATFLGPDGGPVAIRGKVFIDSTYEGDLLAKAGVPFRVGREGREEYDESLAPERGDGQVQAYNFRLIMTREPTNRVAPVAPPGYRREDFASILPLLASGGIKKVFDYPSQCLFKAQTPPLPNGKYDINDVSRGLVRLSLPGRNLAWPDGDAEARRAVFADHLRDQVGLLFFLQDDASVPQTFRDEAREWGWCRDEFVQTGHLPPQLYVREARRMVGEHVYTQEDSSPAPGDARAVLHRDAIAMGDYGNNCHGTDHEGPRFGGKHAGEFYNSVPPYQIPYGVMLPRGVANLLVPVAASSSHVGFCALRYEPIWMSLGQAAGHAASMAVAEDVPVGSVSVPSLQGRLHAARSATIYVSDVSPDSPDFAAVQWWGTLGGLHGLAPAPAQPGRRGAKIHGQYYQATPGHAAELDRPLDAALARRWSAMAKEFGLDLGLPADGGERTRGDFLRAAWTASRGKISRTKP